MGCPSASACARQDFEASDTVDSAMDLVQLNRLLRPGVRLVKGMEVKQAGGIFEFSMMTVVSWFKVRSRNTLRPCNARDNVSTWSRSGGAVHGVQEGL